MDFNDRKTWTTVLGISYIDPIHLRELLEKLDTIQLIADFREKGAALVQFGIECKRLSAREHPYPNADHFRYGELDAFLEHVGGPEALPDLSAKLKVLLRLQVELGFLCESE